MNTEHPAESPPGDGSQAGAAAASHDAGPLENAWALWHDLKSLAHDLLLLATLEARRAGESLVAILAYGIVVGVLVSSAWLCATGALVLWAIDRGIPAGAAMLGAALVNLMGAFGFAVAIRRKSRHLQFPATMRSLRPNDDAAGVEQH